MKKSNLAVNIISIVMAVVLLFSLAACIEPPSAVTGIPSYLLDKIVKDDGTDSWTKMGDEQIEIEWYVDLAAWPQPTSTNAVLAKIKEITGISIKFSTPVDNSNDKLTTMISGGDLPDVVTIQTSNTKVMAQLAMQGYVYDINLLADNFAPSFYRNVREDVFDWWAMGNGKTYGIPNHAYSYEDIPDGTQLQPNGGMMVRKDLFDLWQAHAETLKDADGKITYKSRTTGEDKKVEWQGYITTPEGFREACKWINENHKKEIDTCLQLAQFPRDNTCISLKWLSQLFAIPFENADGTYSYQFTTEAYENMLYYLNDLYNDGIISDGNFTQSYDKIGSVIAGGRAFATLVTPQDYQIHFQTANEGGKQYVPLYITNEQGDAPVMEDVRGYGYLYSMITTKCQRPDLVMKLFDFLTSEEGQRLIALGEEGVTWNWADADKKEIVFTEQYLADKAKLEETKYGIMVMDLFINYQYYDNVQPKTNHNKTAGELYRTNLKRPMTMYSYDFNANHFVVDATDRRFNKYSTALTQTNNLLAREIPKIIKAADKEAAKKLYDSTVTTLNGRTYNLPLIIELNSEAYIATKIKLGMTATDNAWPAYKQGYNVVPDRTKPNGDPSYIRGY